MKRARPNQDDEATRQLLDKITKACDTCQTFSAPQQLSSLATTIQYWFEPWIGIQPMCIEKKAVQHAVDIETRFNSANFLSYKIIEAVWDAFLICWAFLYLGFPMKMRVNQKSTFSLLRWTNRAKASGTDVQESGIEAHNSLGSGEIYHAPLRKIILRWTRISY